MLTGRYTAIIISLVVHVLILVFLAKTTVVPSLDQQLKPAPLKSYIYTPPAPANEITIIEAPDIEPKEEQPEKAVENQPPEDSKPQLEPAAKRVVHESVQESQPESEENSHTESIAQDTTTESTTTQKSNPANASAWQMLEALNKEKDEAFFNAQEFSRSRPNTGSIMHGTPTLVPHSTIRPTKEEIINATSQHVGGGSVVTKGDNGNCTITSDLSHVGMEGITAVSGFRCGETKQNRAFREHMAKFRARVGK